MDDLAASRERYPLQTMRLPDGEPFAYRYHRNPSARATIVLLPGGIGLSDCSACILNGSSRTARSSPSIIRSGSRRTPNWRVPSQVEADASPDTDAAAPASDGVGRDAQDARPVVWRTAADAGPVRCPQAVAEQAVSAAYGRFADRCCVARRHGDGGHLALLVRMDECCSSSEDDHTFNQANKDALVRLMPDPTVVTDLTGGHLALLVRMDEYMDTVRAFIGSHAARS